MRLSGTTPSIQIDSRSFIRLPPIITEQLKPLRGSNRFGEFEIDETLTLTVSRRLFGGCVVVARTFVLVNELCADGVRR